MNENTLNASVDFSPHELCATIEALYESISNRFRWTVLAPESGSGAEIWQTLDVEIAQASLDMLLQAYTKAVLTLRTWPSDQVDDQFLFTFAIPDEVWDVMDQIERANTWGEIPRHDSEDHDDCGVCRFMRGT